MLSVTQLARGVGALALGCLTVRAATHVHGEDVTLRDLPNVLWERVFGDDAARYRPDAIAVAGSGDGVWAAGFARPAGPRRDGSGQLWVWRIDADGRKVLDVPVTALDGLSDVSARVHGLTILPSGDVLLVAEVRPEEASVIRITADGRVAAVRRLDPLAGVKILGACEGPGGTLSLVGRRGEHAYVARVDAEGIIRHESGPHRGRSSAFTGGACDERRTCALVGYASDDEPSDRPGAAPPAKGASEPRVWVAVVDARGEVVKETTFPGRGARLALASAYGVTVVYDKSAGSDVDVWVRRLDSELQPVWAERVYTAAHPAAPGGFKIAALADGGVVVFGEQARRGASILVARIGRDGRKAWSYEADPMRRPWHWASSDLRVAGSHAFLLTTVFSLRDPKTPNYKIGVIKLQVD